MKFTIPGRLPGLNDLVGQCHWAVYARKKKTSMETVMWAIRAARLEPIEGRATVTITCYELNKRRDEDNVQSGAAKIILDALQKMGVLKGDGQKYCHVVHRPVETDKDNPRIEVEVTSV